MTYIYKTQLLEQAGEMLGEFLESENVSQELKEVFFANLCF